MRATAAWVVLLASIATGLRAQEGFVSLRLGQPSVAGLEHRLDRELTGTVEESLQALAAAAGLHLIYASDLPRLDQAAPAPPIGVTVRQALRIVLTAGGLDLLIAPDGRAVLRAFSLPRGSGAVIRGVVRESGTGTPVPAAVVVLDSAGRSVITGADGRFHLAATSPGPHLVRARAIGYRPGDPVAVEITAGRDTALALDLERAPVRLSDIVVSPGTFTTRPTGGHHLDRAELESATQIGEDVYRAINRLPGIDNNDNTAAFRVRGAPHDELYVTLDGLELVEPFHLKDFDNALSVIDPQVIGEVDLSTGGFPARWGDRLTGVLAFTSLDRAPGRGHQLGLSISNVRGLSSGSLGGDRGTWLASVRRGYLDLVLDIADPHTAVKPRYADAFAKTTFRWPSGLRLGVHGLAATDDLNYQENEDKPRIESRYGTAYGWVTLATAPEAARRFEAVASIGRLTWHRRGIRRSEIDASQDLSVRDTRGYTVLGLRFDAQADWTARFATEAGLELRPGWAAYDYAGWQRTPYLDSSGVIGFRADTTNISDHPRGTRLGGYLRQRFAPAQTITVEAGLRADRWTWLRSTWLSPRLHAAWHAGERVTFRGAWGRYTQGQGLHQLQVQDGDGQFASVEQAEQRALSAETVIGGGLASRVEVFERRIRNPRPRYLNLDGAQELFPEWLADRIRLDPATARVRGLELLLAGRHRSVAWSGSYRHQASRDRVAGKWIPREFDARHTVTLEMSYQPSPAWLLSAAALYHSGWPVTEAHFEIELQPDGSRTLSRLEGPLQGARLWPYYRVDLRVTRDFRAGAGRIRAFLELFNLTDRANQRGYNLEPLISSDYQRVATLREPEELFPLLLGFGVLWEP